MEVLARDLRALGLYTARSLSYDGVEYELVEHPLTPEQRAIYDAYAGAFAKMCIRDSIEGVIRFVLYLAEEIELTGLWGFEVAYTCSRPRLDAFGGGAHVIDLGKRKSIGWTSTHEWLEAALRGEDFDA